VADEIYFQVLNYNYKEPIGWHLGGNSEKSDLIGTNETEYQPIERNMKVLNLSVALRVNEPGISLSADSDCNEMIAAATEQRIMRIFAFLF